VAIRRSIAETPSIKASKLSDDGRQTSLSIDEKQEQSFENIPNP
jgi:hypothetical protein